MKKFYIPTSTLNFNNILSSESISPKAYYDKRGFGYSRWATIPENPFNNAIVLYDNLCYFDRPKSDIEDHPLLIEVMLDEAQLKQADGFWYSDHTIYFTPRNTSFLFFNEKDRTIALSMSESSLETKLIRLYAKQIRIIQKPVECYNIFLSNEPCELNELEIEKDIRINKMKGLLYGYYIGSILSSDIDSVKYLNVLKEIHNIFAAILSSFEKRPTAYQNERLELLFDYITEQNSDFKSLYEIINSPALDAMGKAKRIWALASAFFRRGSLQNEDKNAWLSCLQYASEKDEKENQAIIWIKQKIDNAKRQMWSKKRLLNPADSEIVVMDNNLYSLKNSNLIDEMDNRLCVSWINEILSDKNTHGRISTYKEELAKNLTLKAKEVYQDSWENCQTRVYLNDLRRHIAGEEFKHEWNNGLLSSIAAVLIAGDDWEKMLSFMQSKEMNDYKLAFAFYGALNGFANLTRDFTDILLGRDKNYVWDVYQEFYGQLIGERITEIVESDRGMEEHKPVAIQQTMLHENAVEAFPEAMAIKGHLKYSEKKHGKFIELIIDQRITDWDRIKKMSKGKDWVAIIDELSKSAAKMEQPTLFDEVDPHPIGPFFYCDKNVWYHIEPLVNNPKAKKEMIWDGFKMFFPNQMVREDIITTRLMQEIMLQ